MVLQGLESEHIDSSFLVVSPTATTGLTYIINDSSAQTRTCIATPINEDITTDEVQTASVLLKDASLLHLDSRHTKAALFLAIQAVIQGIPVVLDVEKDRPPYLTALLPLCDVIVTNDGFLHNYFGRPENGEQLKLVHPNTHSPFSDDM